MIAFGFNDTKGRYNQSWEGFTFKWYARVFDLDESTLFIIAALALIPLAWVIGEATEHAAEHTGPGVGGFLNASFGNAPELIIALFAVANNLPGVVRGSLTGSVADDGGRSFHGHEAIRRIRALAGGTPLRQHLGGNLERRIAPAELLARALDLVGAERRAVRARGAGLGRRAEADGGAARDHRRLVGCLGRLQRTRDRLRVVAVDAARVPAGRATPRPALR